MNKIIRSLSNLIPFLIVYILFIIPTYLLPYLGSNSYAIHGAINILSSPTNSNLAILNIPFYIHLIILAFLVMLSWFRGSVINKKWLAIFPFLALIFDLMPLINNIPLVPTIMHIITIIISSVGASSNNLLAAQNNNLFSAKDVRLGFGSFFASILFVSIVHYIVLMPTKIRSHEEITTTTETDTSVTIDSSPNYQTTSVKTNKLALTKKIKSASIKKIKSTTKKTIKEIIKKSKPTSIDKPNIAKETQSAKVRILSTYQIGSKYTVRYLYKGEEKVMIVNNKPAASQMDYAELQGLK